MTRRETIIIAAVVNVVILAALLVTAIKTEPSPSNMVSSFESNKRVELAIAPKVQKEVATPKAPIELPSYVTESLAVEIQEHQEVAAPEAAVPVPAWKDVVVKKGDTLDKIAKLHGTTAAALMRHNNLASTSLSIGQKLKIQTKGAPPATLATNASESSAAVYYVVKSGDNPWTIAVKNKMKVDELLKLNNLNEEKARRLKQGDRLRIR